jgi:hypothetical protein
MSYVVKETRAFSRSAADLLALAGAIVTELGGKPPKKPAAAGELRAEFNKSVGGTAFGNRVQLIVRASDDPQRAGGGALTVEAYPIDPLGKPLLFGVISEPARLVTGALWTRLAARLSPVAR